MVRLGTREASGWWYISKLQQVVVPLAPCGSWEWAVGDLLLNLVGVVVDSWAAAPGVAGLLFTLASPSFREAKKK